MRAFRTAFVTFGLLVGLPLGCLLLYWTMMLKGITDKTEPTPLAVSVAQLAEKGAPANLHVTVTDLAFGRPVVESGQEGWVCVWLPVQPAAAPEGAPRPAIFFRADVHDQAALDQLRKHPPAEVLVASGLPRDSRWRVKAGRALADAYPGLDMDKAMFLAAPRLSVLGQPIELSDPRVHDVTYASVAAWTGGGLLLIGLVSLYLLVRGLRAKADERPAGPDAEAKRVLLRAERPESLHAARTGAVLAAAAGYGLLTGGLCGGVVLLAAVAVKAQSEGNPLAAVVAAFLVVPALYVALAVGRAFLRRCRWPTDIALCPSGLRWRRGRRHQAFLWSEVEEVRRDIKVIRRVTRTGLIGAYAELKNPTPPIIIDSVLITLATGESLTLTPNTVTDYKRLAETAPVLWKDDTLGRENSGVMDQWLKALPEAARSRQNQGDANYY